MKDTDKEINTVKKRVRQKLGNKIDQGKLDATVRTEVARLINSHKEGAASFGSRVLDPRFANKIATEINKEQQTIKKQALPKDARDKLKQELRDIDQDVLDGVLDPEAAEIIKDDIRNEYGEGDPTVTGIEKTTEEGTQVSPEVEAAVREQSTPDPDAETDLIKKVLKGKTLTDLFKDVAGNRAQIYALMPKVRKGAFHGIFDAGTNPDPALWESVFDDRRMKSKLKKLIEKRIDEANKPLSTDKDAGSIRDGSIEFLEGDKKTVARFMPLLGKLKRAFPDTKIIISKAKIQERLIEGGRDPGIYDTIKGMYSSDGEVLLNPDLMDAETPIHEFGHIWAKAVKYQRPELYRRGVQLIKKSPFWTEIQEKSRDPKSVYYNYGRDQMLEEAMATAIGQRGEQIFNRKQDQSQWDSLRQQILDWVGQRLGINKVQDMGLLEFLDLAATEIVTGEQLIPLEDTGALKDSGILEHLEVPVGTTRDYTRSTPPVKEFDTHGTFKGHKIQQELQPALDKLMPGEWIAWTTGKYGNAVPDHKRNAKLDARIQAKVEGTRKWLESKGYQLKQDPVNPGTHIVSVDLREIAEFERGRKEAASQLKKDGSKKPGPRRPLLWFSEATDADIKEIERFEKERKEAASKIKRTGSKKPGFPRRPLLWFSQATPEGKNANDVIRKIKKNLARGLKRQGDYKKSKVTAPTRQVIEATKKSFDKVGDQLSFEQLQDLNNKLKELIAADFQAQRDSKNKIRDNVNEIIKDKSGIDPSEKVSREDVRQGNTCLLYTSTITQEYTKS
ncbi:MAG: hypothetical protein MPJ25_10455, partial [Pirellulales bacterium]|nr:hypothetical protein [Pirellulales bacterium]